jgi:membrane dipeptidase
MVAIFDGHNDTVLSLINESRSFMERSTVGHIDLPRAREGGLMGGFFAIWVPDPGHLPTLDGEDGPDLSAYEDPDRMPPVMDVSHAQKFALKEFALLSRIARDSSDEIRIIKSTADLRQALADGAFAMELHLEGAEPIDPALDALELFYAAGVRSIGIVWSRSNAFAHGVPFQFPGSPNVGPGLTDAGKALVKCCNELGILIDLSHLNEAGFWDVDKISEHPLVATHSGVHAISPSTRNLTDRQLDAIRDSDGIVGVNFHVGFLRPDGAVDAKSTSVSAIADHVDYVVDRIGIDKVAFGSDFDGAVMPGDLQDAAGMPKLVAELENRGYDEPALRQIGYENWIRVLDLTWKH